MKVLHRTFCYLLAASGLLPSASSGGEVHPRRAVTSRPLWVHPANARYFTDDGKRAIYLTGSHTWQNLQDGGPPDSARTFDSMAFLDFLAEHNHNFFRLWHWESSLGSAVKEARAYVRPLPFLRAGPGKALDGRPKFDLSRFDPEYFQRLHDRVKAAQDRGIYVGVMLFQGFGVAKKTKRAYGNPWPGHPFHRANNINGIDGDPDGDGNGYEVHTLDNPHITAIQDAYVRKVIDTVGEFDNVIFEISNESHGASTEWQYHMIDVIRDWERTKTKQHPVWMSFQFDETRGAGTNRALFESKAEAISPGQAGDNDRAYRSDPPVADGSKVILLDTDHFWGVGGDVAWVWKTFTRGMHAIFMDPYGQGARGASSNADARWDDLRNALGLTLRIADTVDLAAMTPAADPALCSTRYCLRNPGLEYVVFQPGGGSFTVRVDAGTYRVEWHDPVTGRVQSQPTIHAGTGMRRFVPPSRGAWVLLLSARPLR